MPQRRPVDSEDVACVVCATLWTGIFVGWAIIVFTSFSTMIGGCGYPFTPDHPAGADCRKVCEHLSQLGCEEANGDPGPDLEAGTEDDVQCYDACILGTDDAMRGCMVSATSCVAAVEEC